MHSKTAFLVTVFGGYERFIHSYCYFIDKNYPDSDIIIFSDNHNSAKLSKIKEEFIQIRLFKESFGLDSLKTGGGRRNLRWLVPYSFVKEYDYLYIGDVDILIMKESIDLFIFHQNIMSSCNLPFSNKVRYVNGNKNSFRLSGLHCVNVQKYYRSLDDQIKSLLNDKALRDNYFYGLDKDEHFLYKLCFDTFKFDWEKIAKNERPWHGFHLGVLRGNKRMNYLQFEENSSISYSELRSQLVEAISDPKFKIILQKTDCPELFWMFREFNIPLPFNLWFKSHLLSFELILNKIKNKL